MTPPIATGCPQTDQGADLALPDPKPSDRRTQPNSRSSRMQQALALAHTMRPRTRHPAEEALSDGLRDLLDTGRTIPCSTDPHLWTSDRHTERAEAITRCKPCPLRHLCHAAAHANQERWGVWAGIDRSPRNPAEEH